MSILQYNVSGVPVATVQPVSTDITAPVKKKKVKKEVDISIPPIAKYGLLMGRNKYIRLDSVQSLIDSKRHFTLYKWMPDISSRHMYAYLPWITYAGGKFAAVKVTRWVTPNKTMIPMHIWFKGDQELREWLGDAMFSMLVADLM
jgi:hypothetical protein